MKISRQSFCRRHPGRGFMLVECLIYIGILFLILGLAFEMLIQVMERSRRLEVNAIDMASALRAGERWRDEIRQARGEVRISQSTDGVVCQIPMAQREVAYAFRDGAIFRREDSQSAWRELLPRVAESRFEPDQRRFARGWRWELQLKGKRVPLRLASAFTFLAVPAPNP